MNIPGVCTLTGEPMGGWIQYSMSQTVAAWLAQHFYLHWKYSADRTFLKERAYPFLKDVAIYLEQVSEVTPEGVRKLEFSSSPEVFDNSLQAWFSDMTNYDLAMMHFLFKAAAELAHELNLTDESSHWAALEAQLPDYDVDEEGCLTFAKGYPYNESHRHFSHAMAIHPMGLIDWSDGEKSQHIIRATLKRLDEVGPDYWTGYSYSWLANMKARAFDGKGAAQALRTFAECFCLKNTFHANGDQTKSGKSRFTYRPSRSRVTLLSHRASRRCCCKAIRARYASSPHCPKSGKMYRSKDCVRWVHSLSMHRWKAEKSPVYASIRRKAAC